MSVLYPFVKRHLANFFSSRSDGSPVAPTYFPWDFDGLAYEPFSFYSQGWKINGYRYTYGDEEPKGLIVFHHGLGAGHFSYTALIYDLAKMGYVVYAYDNIGCSLSEGRAVENMALAVLTQKDFYDYLETDPKAKGLKRISVGHSWGGWVALCALAGAYKVDKVISFAGFTSMLNILTSRAPKDAPHGKGVVNDMRHYLKSTYGDIVLFDALEELKTTDKDVLYIQGDKDNMVSFERNGKAIMDVAKENKHVKVMVRKGMDHDPFWTKEGEKYYLTLIKGKNSFTSREREKNVVYDRRLLTENDEEVLKAVNDFLAR